jgi:uncharacterized protein YggL (DUF469 family)
MNKRLRKKKRIGEFQEFGFEVGFRFSNKLDEEARANLIDSFIEKAIEDNGLQFGGGGGESEWNGFVTTEKARCSTSTQHQEAVKQWFDQKIDILEYYITPMIDSWNGDFDNVEKQWVKK